MDNETGKLIGYCPLFDHGTTTLFNPTSVGTSFKQNTETYTGAALSDACIFIIQP